MSNILSFLPVAFQATVVGAAACCAVWGDEAPTGDPRRTPDLTGVTPAWTSECDHPGGAMIGQVATFLREVPCE